MLFKYVKIKVIKKNRNIIKIWNKNILKIINDNYKKNKIYYYILKILDIISLKCLIPICFSKTKTRY